MDLWFHISLLHRSCAGNVFCTHLPTFRTHVVHGEVNIKFVDMKGLWTHFHVWLRNVKSACDVWELCHKLLNCLNLQLCSVERSLNIILSLIFRCAGAGSTISWVMEPGWKGSTVPRYWLRSSCSQSWTMADCLLKTPIVAAHSSVDTHKWIKSLDTAATDNTLSHLLRHF